jgi:hypothetical protein
MGRTACNGWRFWTVEGDEPAPAEKKGPKAAKSARGSTAKPQAAAKPKRATKKATKLLYPMPDQSGATQDMTRWWCNACMRGFEVYGAEKPEQCPDGHRMTTPSSRRPRESARGQRRSAMLEQDEVVRIQEQIAKLAIDAEAIDLVNLTIAAVLTVISVTVAGIMPALLAPSDANANPNCAGNSDNFKKPNGGVVHDFNGCR